MKTFWVTLSIAIGVLALWKILKSSAPRAAANPDVEWVVTRAQPSIFLIQSSGDLRVRVPIDFALDQSRLDKDFAQYQQSGGDADEHTFAWRVLAADPKAYLVEPQQFQTLEFSDRPYCTGTGFAVSREGILLTNAHVVADPEADEFMNDPASAALLLDQPMSTLLEQTLRPLLGKEPADLADAADTAIQNWVAGHSQLSGKFTHADVAINFGTSDPREISNFRSALLVPRPIFAPAKVLACGEPYPGKDVAVLKVDLSGLRLLPATEGLPPAPELKKELASLLQDQLICLPLGDSSEVEQGTRVEAMGFPGVAFSPTSMNPQEEYHVDAQDGQIAQTRSLTTRVDAFEMTANINHGDSGGPVLDSRGLVIAITVVVRENAPSHNLAIPINVAKELLRRAGITPDLGPLTAHWRNGVELFAAGQYPQAEQELETCAQMQGEPGPGTFRLMPDPPTVHPAVIELLARCREREGKPRELSSVN